MKLFGVGAAKGDTAAVAPPAPIDLGEGEAPLRPPPPIGDAASAQTTAPGTEIRYDPGLIPHFMEAHRGLSALATQLQAKVVEGRYIEATQLLRQFKTDIFRHFLEENVRFYTYLTYCLKTDVESGAVMADMRREMGEVGRTITRFLKIYEMGVDMDNADSFLRQFEDVMATLGERIQREEGSLYTLYRPPSEFAANS